MSFCSYQLTAMFRWDYSGLSLPLLMSFFNHSKVEAETSRTNSKPFTYVSSTIGQLQQCIGYYPTSVVASGRRTYGAVSIATPTPCNTWCGRTATTSSTHATDPGHS